MAHIVAGMQLGPDPYDRADAKPPGDRQEGVQLRELLQDDHGIDAQLPRPQGLYRCGIVNFWKLLPKRMQSACESIPPQNLSL